MEQIEKFEEKEPEKELIEGFIGGYKDWQEKLPPGVKLETVELNLEKDGYHWHLRPEHIKNEEEREKYIAEKKQWEEGVEEE